MSHYRRFSKDEDGAVLIDWTVLTASVVLLAIGAINGVFKEAMLDVVDNLDRAIDAGAEHADVSSADTLLRGIELVRDQFLAKLAALDVVRLEALGEAFDPLQHDAVSIAPAETPDQIGRVLAVAREGYLIRDEVLRPAAVIVGAQS